MPSAASQRGLLKLMLRLPALRGQLQLLCAKNQSLASLCEAYEEASSMLDRQRRLAPLDHPMISEYELICREIEEEVISVCIADTGT
ncbi:MULTISPECIES: hypothetical protein [unclassified Ensifer]|jgi:hypothetical protein|uniref:hypothetical protein n=1 Tax=Ensifer TaxID=106591 RepID=UPI000713754D|nr:MULTISPECIES: hypothetical protein [unclassified Ensifer]KSV78818.1 hypothetical protein N185_12975 [Sinorhizobium sp. GW3]KQX16062.1 hypothetical protein ASD01_05710 [Ensifer sp. Root423]KQX43355.1 hypothetical protein ASD49_11970 [Ensifer sp. Root1298]KQX72905.1 hypothetical protein ASD41_12470 [Ensifer sp. Root1312]KRC15871.1 hypothetical protein ASE29_12025 [Ensifer sp. Root74]